MDGKLKPLPFRKVEKIVLGNNFVFISQTGSHRKYKRETDDRVDVTMIPKHETVSKGMLSKIRRDTGKERDEFINV